MKRSICKLSLPSSSILAHPFELAMALVFLLTGGGIVLSGFHLQVTNVQRELPNVLVGVWSFALLGAGVLIAVGIAWMGRLAVGRAVEKAGHVLAISGWGTYAITILGFAESSRVTVTVLTATALCLGCAGRIYALYRLDRAEDKIRSLAGG